MENRSTNSEQYWPTLPDTDLVSDLMDKVTDYYDYLRDSGRMDMWRRSYEFYYRALRTGGKTFRTGEQGEFTVLHNNQFHSILRQMHIMCTQQKLAFEARATNTDHASEAQTILAQSLLEMVLREKKLQSHQDATAMIALIFGEGYLRATWDFTAGKMLKDKAVQEGDIDYAPFFPWNVIRDYTKETSENHDWYITQEYKNKYTLAAKYPEYADRITKLGDDSQTRSFWNERKLLSHDKDSSDDIPVYTFYHKSTLALPEGKQLTFLEDDLVLATGPLIYETLPLERMCAEELYGSTFGYTVAFDLLPLQEILDILISTVVSNQEAGGVQVFWVPRGANLNLNALSGGMKVIEGTPGLKPEVMNFVSTPEEVFNFIRDIVSYMEIISGVNAVSRGNPQGSLGKDASGAALALVQAQAVQSSSPYQQSYIRLAEDVGTATVKLFQKFSISTRMITVAGKNKRAYMKEFEQGGLSSISRVLIDVGSPISRTVAGKVAIADQLLKAGLVDNPDQYLQLLNTGNLENLTESKTSELMLIREENERLAEGKPVSTLITDRHDLHILEHASVGSSPLARENPQIMLALAQHIQEHIELYRSMDPVLAALLHMTPLTQAPAAPEGPGANLSSPPPSLNEAPNTSLPSLPGALPGTDEASSQIIEQNQAANAVTNPIPG